MKRTSSAIFLVPCGLLFGLLACGGSSPQSRSPVPAESASAESSSSAASGLAAAESPSPASASQPMMTSEILNPHPGELTLVQRVMVAAPPEVVWKAFTTAEGWRAWVAPVVSVDFRIDGLIQSQYDPEAKIGDPGTIRLHILNYAPYDFITMQGEVADHFPQITKEDEKRMYSITTFRPTESGGTELVAYGVGYRDTPEHKEILDLFIKYNGDTYKKLIDWSEQQVTPALENSVNH